jgi:hypothetical protein
VKIIYPEKQTSTGSSATSENGAFPISNLFDDKPGKLWKAADSVQVATVIVAIGANSNAIALFNTNATSITIVMKDNGGATISTTNFTLNGTRTYNRIWLEYTSQATSHTAEIELTTTAPTIQAGVVKAGMAVDFKNPQYGISEYPIDYSKVEELSNGAKYVKSRDIIRGFNIIVNVVRASDFYNLWDIIVAYGKTPMAVLMAENIIDSQWCVFGTIESFSGTHQHLIDSVVSLTFEESV